MDKKLTPIEAKLLQSYGLEVTEQEPVSSTTTVAPSRTEVRKKFAQMKELSQEDLDAFNHLYEVFGINDLSEVCSLMEEEIDTLADEVVSIRGIQDMLGGREQTLRSYIFDTINLNLSDPETQSGYLLSPELGVKLSKEVSGGKLSVDPEKLKDVLDPERFASVTNMIVTSSIIYYPNGTKKTENSTIYEINENALQDELVKGNIGVEEILKATKTSPRKTAFYVRKSS